MGCSSSTPKTTPGMRGDMAVGGREALKAMNSIILEGNEQLGPAIHDVFRGYDKNGNGNIDKKELKMMVEELSSIIPSANLMPNEAQRIADVVMKALDIDNSGVVDEKEFSTWLKNQIEDADNRKGQLIAGGDDGKALFKFLSAVEACLKMQLAGVGIFRHDVGYDPDMKKSGSQTRDGEIVERRYDGEHGPFPKSEFIEHYGADEGEAVWRHSEQETRLADDGEHYTLDEFIEHYGGIKEWKAAF